MRHPLSHEDQNRARDIARQTAPQPPKPNEDNNYGGMPPAPPQNNAAPGENQNPNAQGNPPSVDPDEITPAPQGPLHDNASREANVSSSHWESSGGDDIHSTSEEEVALATTNDPVRSQINEALSTPFNSEDPERLASPSIETAPSLVPDTKSQISHEGSITPAPPESRPNRSSGRPSVPSVGTIEEDRIHGEEESPSREDHKGKAPVGDTRAGLSSRP